MGKRELVALLSLSSQRLVIVVRLFLAMTWACLQFVLFVYFVALRFESTAMTMAGRSVHLKAFFLGKLDQAVSQYFVHILSLVTDNSPSLMIQQKGVK